MLRGYNKYVLRPMQNWLQSVIYDLEKGIKSGRFTGKESIEDFLELGTTKSANSKELKKIIQKAYGLSIENAVLQYKRQLNQINSFASQKYNVNYTLNTEFKRDYLRVLVSNKYFRMEEISKYAKRYGAELGTDITKILMDMNNEEALKGEDKFQILKLIQGSTADDLKRNGEVAIQKKLKKFMGQFNMLISTQAQRAYQDTKYILHGKSKDKVLDPFLRGYRWRATGSRACAICRARDGKFFEPHEVPYDHPRGMCDLEEVYRSDTDELLARWATGELEEETAQYVDGYIKHLEKIGILQKGI